MHEFVKTKKHESHGIADQRLYVEKNNSKAQPVCEKGGMKQTKDILFEQKDLNNEHSL